MIWIFLIGAIVGFALGVGFLIGLAIWLDRGAEL